MFFKDMVSSEYENKTLYDFLRQKLDFSHRFIGRLKKKESFLVNGEAAHVSSLLKLGDIIDIDANISEINDSIEAEKMDIKILYEDPYLIALDKAPFTSITPIGKHRTKTLANGLAYYYMTKGEEIKIRPVNRLDLNTTGIVVFAKNSFIHDQIRKQIMKNLCKREYLGIVEGVITKAQDTIDLPIARVPGSIIHRHISKEGLRAISHYELIESFKDASLVKFSLDTGRTHQIRVHAEAIGHPLIGDDLYSNKESNHIKRQALHSHSFSFFHPRDNNLVEIRSPLPEDMKFLIDNL